MHHPSRKTLSNLPTLLLVLVVYVCVQVSVYNCVCFLFLFKTSSGVTSMEFAVQNKLVLKTFASLMQWLKSFVNNFCLHFWLFFDVSDFFHYKNKLIYSLTCNINGISNLGVITNQIVINITTYTIWCWFFFLFNWQNC